MTNDPTFLSSVILIMVAFGGAFLAALWLALVIWTWRDIRNRSRDQLVQALAVLVVAALNLPGVLVYMILRPAQTIEEEYQHTLEEEALLVSIENQSLCPGCERHVDKDWQVCPNCHSKLKTNCQKCQKLMELSWDICPYCGTPAPGLKLQVESAEWDNPGSSTGWESPVGNPGSSTGWESPVGDPGSSTGWNNPGSSTGWDNPGSSMGLNIPGIPLGSSTGLESPVSSPENPVDPSTEWDNSGSNAEWDNSGSSTRTQNPS